MRSGSRRTRGDARSSPREIRRTREYLQRKIGLPTRIRQTRRLGSTVLEWDRVAASCCCLLNSSCCISPFARSQLHPLDLGRGDLAPLADVEPRGARVGVPGELLGVLEPPAVVLVQRDAGRAERVIADGEGE